MVITNQNKYSRSVLISTVVRKIVAPIIILSLFAALNVTLSFADEQPYAISDSENSADVDYKDLSNYKIEDLLDLEIEVTSVYKKVGKLSESPAAVYVITQEDIRRSGLNTLAEILRMVPGLQVININANTYVVGSRGFVDRLANKMLVLIDGRSVYAPYLSGVWWDVQDTFIKDIDRIEVIKGPGATQWGANAVSGVINIITKSARDSIGGLVTETVGSETRNLFGFRFGDKLGEKGYYRVYSQYRKHDNFVDENGNDSYDKWNQFRCGFRYDSQASKRDLITLQGDYYKGSSNQQLASVTYTPPYIESIYDKADVSGTNIIARWERTHSNEAKTTAQFYYDRTERTDWRHDMLGQTWDLDIQHAFSPGRKHDVLFGAGYRFIKSDLNLLSSMYQGMGDRKDHLLSAFIQDEIKIKPDRFKLIIGSKFEHNSYTGFEIQPSVRTVWTPDKRNTFWTAISRAVRTPCQFEHEGNMTIGIVPSENGLANVIRVLGNKNFDSEELIAYEAGYRTRPRRNLSFDIAAFYNDYSNLRSLEMSAPSLNMDPAPHVVIPIAVDNKMSARVYGAELVANWQATDFWKLCAGYSVISVNTEIDPTSSDVVASAYEECLPKSQLHLRSFLDLPGNMELDILLNRIGEMKSPGIGYPIAKVPAYTRLDARLGWNPKPDLEVSIGVQNLLDKKHPEFSALFSEYVTQAERSFYGRLTWRF